ncbi:hypothetical protein FQO85_19750 [Salmonella enterica]|uniref:Uncharacterized protein n=2 Tax=Salmonella enterica I TaxID=59201 RepID=A0A5U3G4Z7_SALET|nr:hypothetical protein [Salmonella enterica]EBP4060897.1 hypothetical protein [Salmonella enterica subsp. enterica]EBU7818420.1 hypothetical protein [Salmonella enterica subsp. enterica serovar Oranienburg]EBY9400591.1 hypothetical protein [Salmonella enterica subsp. enterica serovar Kisarawe]ECB4059554.1 hypothetical protein [Salmonella enterica subsp. enterica serovar Minnesota]ECF2430815.1 hypothetical protein [Salmonella enterica subsp. enterica serovar Beaudesert]ECI5366586.1 hypothetic
MNNLHDYQARLADIAKRSKAVLSWTSAAQFKDGAFIADDTARAASIFEAATKDPIFEGVNESITGQIATAWASALADYSAKYKTLPRPEVLASCHQTLENCLLESARKDMGNTNKAMLESVSKDMMSVSDGVMRLPLFLAMILPSQLGAATSDACTYIPVTRDQSDIYEIINVAGSSFGSYAAGDPLDMQSVGVYSQLRRRYVLVASADGSAKTFTFKMADHEGQAVPIRKGRSNIYVNRIKSAVDNGSGTLLHTFANNANKQITVTCSLNYNTGQIDLSFSEAPDAGTEIAIEAEINIEAAPELIPLINHEMAKYTLFPSQYVIAAEHTVQAAYEAQREFGIDMGSLQFRTLKDYLAHEQDMLRLRIMVWRTLHKEHFDIALPQTQTFDVWATIIKGKFQTVYRNIIERVKSSGSQGMFAGADAASFFKQLPPSYFQPAEDYTQTPYVHFIGTLFGNVKVFEVPVGVCENLSTEGMEFNSMDVLCYVRDENPGKAGFVTGDAVPAVPFQHPTSTALVNRTTLWGSAVNDMHPRNGEEYFTKVSLTMAKDGGINFLTGETIDAGKSA